MLNNSRFEITGGEPRLPSGNIPAFACGPLTRERYINPKIEQELVEFKVEIEEKFYASDMNKTFRFPRPISGDVNPSIQIVSRQNRIDTLPVEELRDLNSNLEKKSSIQKTDLLSQLQEGQYSKRSLGNEEVVIIDEGKQPSNPTTHMGTRNDSNQKNPSSPPSKATVVNKNLQITTKLRTTNDSEIKGSQTSSNA